MESYQVVETFVSINGEGKKGRKTGNVHPAEGLQSQLFLL